MISGHTDVLFMAGSLIASYSLVGAVSRLLELGLS